MRAGKPQGSPVPTGVLLPFQVPPVPWEPLGLQEFPRGLPSSRGQWVHREGEAPRGRRARWGPRAPQENQVGAPAAKPSCLLCPHCGFLAEKASFSRSDAVPPSCVPCW